jgi:hypothetical protein
MFSIARGTPQPLLSTLVASPVLYSTNVYLKLHIHEKWRGDKHYVWCSEWYDSTKAPAYVGTAQIPPSSDPCAIYKELKEALARSDAHCAKVISQRGSFMKLAAGWCKKGEIDSAAKNEIAFLAKQGSGAPYWKPLVYVIPRAAVQSRLKPVPARNRAGLGDEFIIEDLRRSEFDVIEP